MEPLGSFYKIAEDFLGSLGNFQILSIINPKI